MTSPASSAPTAGRASCRFRLGALAVVLAAALAPVARAQQNGGDCLITGTTTAECGTVITLFGTVPQNPVPFDGSWDFIDNLNGAVIVGPSSCTQVPSNCDVNVNAGGAGFFTIRFTIVISGVTKECRWTVVVSDTTPPAITCPPDTTVQCGASVDPSATGNPAATDCSPVTFTFADSTAPNCAGVVITRTWTATDASNNASTCTQTITTVDTTPPTLTCPAAVSVQCFSQLPPPDPVAVGAVDNCGGLVNVVHAGDVASNGQSSCNNVITRTYLGTDPCGNQNTCTQTITVDDTTPPSLTCPSAITVQCFALVPAPEVGTVQTSDNCGGLVTVIHVGDVPSNGTEDCENVIVRTYQGTDPCGNVATCTQTILVDDSTAPSITCPPAVSVGCAGQVPAPDPGSVTASDNCGGPVTITHFGDVPNGGPPCNQIITRTYKAQDHCGNMAFCTQLITVDDTTAPSITCPPDFVLPCGTSTDPSVTGTATATDNCGVTPSVTYSDAVVGACPMGSVITRTWTASDGCNSATCVQIITLIAAPFQGCVPAYVTDLGGSCGNPPPKLTASPPIIGAYLAFRIYNGPPNAPIFFAADAPPFPTPMPLGGTCVLFVDPLDSILLSNFFTDANGDWTVRFEIAQGNMQLVSQLVRVQAGFAVPFSLTNGLELFFGTCPPFCTATKDGYAGAGLAGQVYDFYYSTVFPTGLTIGNYDTSGGAAPPNGLQWDGTAAGRLALKSFLAGAGGPSGPLANDALNPLTTFGGGSLALQTATLALNIGFNNTNPNVLGSGLPGFQNQVYFNYPGVPDSLNGFSVAQILGVANAALATGALPAGYSFDTLATLVQNINEAYDGCSESFWGSKYLFAPVN